MEKNAKIYVAGHRGMAGSAIVRALMREGYTNIVVRTHAELELRDSRAVADFFATEKPEYVFLAAARVGGILANNTYPAEFLFDNVQIQNNVIHQAYVHGVKKLLFLGSSCIYPRDCPQPMKEEYLLTGPLESTNEPYAIAKITGIKMCQEYNRQYGTNFIAAMPTNLYGPNDNFDLQTSHVFPALIRKFTEAAERGDREVVVWGTGTPRREFLHADDMARGCVFLLEHFTPTKEQNEHGQIFFNLGTGTDVSIKELAAMIQEAAGFTGDIVWDITKPDGTPQKLQDVERVHALGWHHTIGLEEGIRQMCEWFKEHRYEKR